MNKHSSLSLTGFVCDTFLAYLVGIARKCHDAMPKSRRRKQAKKTTAQTVKMTPRVREALLAQRDAFRMKFGRDPGPGDPVFFDPDEDDPSPYDMEQDIIESMRKGGLGPEVEYAFRKTGRLGIGADKTAWPAEAIKEWDDAIAEFHQIRAAREAEGPNPQDWNTNIADLLVAPFTKEDHAQVLECINAMAPIEARGMTVITRIELAAAVVSMACGQAYQAAEAEGGGADFFAHTENLILQRAREIYGQGHG
jgi:hypothetical protein